MTAARPAAPHPADSRHEVITFRTQWGRYPVTRGERYRLAILHGLPEHAARSLAFGEGATRPVLTAPRPFGARMPDGTYSADYLARRFDAEGRDRGPQPLDAWRMPPAPAP